MNFNFSLINLGCNKNLVDSQYLIGRIFDLATNNPNYNINYFADPDSEEVNYIFINTCGFLSSGRLEALNTIKNYLNKGKKIYLLGCAVKYWKDLAYYKEAEDILNNENIYIISWDDLDKITLMDLIKGYNSSNIGDYNFPNSSRAYVNAIYKFEYLKIAEGCNNSCSFCIIPKIRGKQKSLPVEKILQEVENMVNAGVEEIILISQDTTRYGIDIYGKPYLFELLEQLERLNYDFRYRILYLYPDIVSLKQLEKLKYFDKFIPYFDIPLQHISPTILKSMKRFYNVDFIYKFLDFINKNWDEKFIRTNFIIGFPGETDRDFLQLVDFVKKGYFHNISLFQYHDEILAPSYKLPNKISYEVISERFNILSSIVENLIDIQQKKLYKNKEIVGNIMNIKNNKLIVKPFLQAPEIDPYHEISFEQIIGVYNTSGEIDIGDKIVYEM